MRRRASGRVCMLKGHKKVETSSYIRMEKIHMLLVLGVLVTLIFAIARQLSEMNTIYRFPDVFGTSYSRHGWDQGIAPPSQYYQY